jgi:poly(ADP-ribose) glycohydrolase ARH3
MTSTLARITQDQVFGLLLGGALGDALGAPFEGQAVVDAAELAARESTIDPLDHTDDTALSLVLAIHVIEHQQEGRILADTLAREFARAWRAEPWRGYGAGTPHVFGLINAGVAWSDAARASFHGQGSTATVPRCVRHPWPSSPGACITPPSSASAAPR